MLSRRAEADVVAQEQAAAAEVDHAGLEAHARAQRRLLEEQCHHAAGQAAARGVPWRYFVFRSSVMAKIRSISAVVRSVTVMQMSHGVLQSTVVEVRWRTRSDCSRAQRCPARLPAERLRPRMSQPSWACSSVRFIAGNSRSTVPCVQLISSRRSMQALHDRRAVDRPARCRSSRPARARRESGRIGRGGLRAARGRRRPVARACSSRFSCSIISMAAMPARAAIGLPPNVAACMPGRRLGAISGVVSKRPAGDAAAERLGQRHDVGRDAEMLIGEPLAGAAAAGLHFVEDQAAGRSRRPACRSPARKPAGGI